MLKEAVEAHNRIVREIDQCSDANTVSTNITIIGNYLQRQMIRQSNEDAGYGYLNREADVIERMLKAIGEDNIG
tara:strand:- start:173 stop:394 length:222 start_codon:yes stop_codon:yes gene_type:complete